MPGPLRPAPHQCNGYALPELLAALTVQVMHTLQTRGSDLLARVRADMQDLMRRSLLRHQARLDQSQAKLDQDLALLKDMAQQVLLEQNQAKLAQGHALMTQAVALLQSITDGLTRTSAHQDAMHIGHVLKFMQLVVQFVGPELADAARDISG